MEDQEPKGSGSYMEHSNPKVRNTRGVQPVGVSSEPSTIPNNSGVKELNSLISSDYHLTVQLKVHLERRQISLLLGVLCYQAIHYGVNFPMYISLLHLNEILLGNKVRSSEIKDRYERLSVELSQVIIRSLAGKTLYFGDLVRVDEKTRKVIFRSKALMTKDTYRSRLIHWRPERFLQLKTVPVDVVIERSGDSVRYSSYCKGYGEGSGTAHRGRTPPSFELDGEETPEWVLSEHVSAKELAQEVFLLAHFEWLKRFGEET